MLDCIAAVLAAHVHQRVVARVVGRLDGRGQWVLLEDLVLVLKAVYDVDKQLFLRQSQGRTKCLVQKYHALLSNRAEQHGHIGRGAVQQGAKRLLR